MPDYKKKLESVRRLIGAVCHADTPEVASLITYCVGRVLMNAPGDGNFALSEHIATTRHVRDWIVSAIIAREPWLKNLDDLGRPRKLMKFSTMEDIVKEADKWMLKAAEKNRKVELVVGEESLEAVLGNGFHVVRLHTPRALDRESGWMQHCVGQGSYDSPVLTGKLTILSLRDAGNKPHVTIEVQRKNVVVQIQGKQNLPPVRKYLEALTPFFREGGYTMEEGCLGGRYVYDTEYEVNDAWDLRNATEIDGDLIRDGAELRLPEKLVVRGDIRLRNCTFPNGFPKILESGGNIDVVKCDLVPPTHVKAWGSVKFRYDTLRGVIDTCVAGLDVDMSHTFTDRLPRELKFNGSLNLKNSEITSLEGVEFVNGDLVIEQTEITALPDRIEIAGDLLAKGSDLVSLPPNAVFRRNVDVSNTKVETIPMRTVAGILDITATKVKSLPDGFSAVSLFASSCTLDNLPADLKIKDMLNLRFSRVKLPAGLTVGGTLNVENARVHRIPDNVSAGELLAGGSELKHIGSNLRAGRTLDLSDTSIVTLPTDMEVGGAILARQSFIRTLPDGFTTKSDLDLTCSEIEILPQGMVVGGDLTLHGTEVTEIPEDLNVKGNLILTHTDVESVPESTMIGGGTVTDRNLSPAGRLAAAAW